MLEDTALTNALGTALAKLLRPLVRLLLTHSFPYSAFESVAKRVYAETAMQDFALPGRKPSASRVSILTGLTRKEVNNLLSTPWDSAHSVNSTHYHRASRVLSAWVREDRFAGEGELRALPVEGSDGFNELVRLHGADVPARAVLDELVRVGAARVRDDGKVEMVQRAFVPSAGLVAKVGILGNDVSELIETITFNINRTQDLRFQRKVLHVDIRVDALPAFRELSSRQAQKLLEGLDEWLSKHDLSGIPETERAPGTDAKVGLGIYYIEEVSQATEDSK